MKRSLGPRRRIGASPFVAVTVGHLAIDVFNSMGPVLVAFLRLPLGLSAAQVGLAVGSYQFLAGATQPPFGWLVDRIGSRWIGPVSLAWVVGFVALALFLGLSSGSYGAFLAVFALAALGSGAFHPQGTLHAAGTTARRTATATAVFFLCGQLGLAGGPALSGYLLERIGPGGIYGLALLSLPVVALMAVGLRESSGHALHHDPSSPPHGERAAGGGPSAVVLLAIIFTCRGWIMIGTASFLPMVFQNAGWAPTQYGIATGLFWLGAGIAGVVAGRVADTAGRRPVVALTTLAGSVLLVFLPVAAGRWTFLVAVLTGALIGAAHSILIVMAQALLPVRRGLASGLALGYLFGVGAVASVLIGVLADLWVLERVLQSGAALGLLAALLTIFLPPSRGRATPRELEPVAEALPAARL